MLERHLRFLQKLFIAAAVIGGCYLLLSDATTSAEEILGTGTGALIGGDLTDPDDNGDPEFDDGYDAIFDSSDEQGFGGGEFAFNVFDNRLGPGNDKWCCGRGDGAFEDDPVWVSAQLPVAHFLTNFTVSSANDVPGRDPTFWAIQGSNDGDDYTNIFEYDDFSPWDERLQVIEWKAPDDFPVQTTSYEYFRMATFNTDLNPSGAWFQVGEIEFFGSPDGEVPPIFIGGEDTIGERSFEGDQSNEMFGPEQTGVPGWSGRIVVVDPDDFGQIGNHTIAEEALDEFEGDKAVAAYPVVDMGGGGGTFPDTQPYPNGVADANQSDFAVQVTADVTIPAGTYTIGFGSDDGGQITINDDSVLFEVASDPNDSFEDNQIRFEGNRGHGWTVGSFTLNEELSTTITASFHERGGGDSFEIAVIEDEVIEAASPDTGWELLGDGTLGWSVTTTTAPLVSADLTATVSASRPMEFDVNGDTGEQDQLVVENPDPDVFTTILDVSGDLTFQIKSAGAVTSGEAFTIIDADQVVGTPTIVSFDPAQTWVFDAETGRVCLDSCPGAVGGGDYDGNGVVDAADADAQAVAMKTPDQNLATFDEDGSGMVDQADRLIWVKNHAFGGKGTWVGDADLNGEFNSGDFVAVFTAGLYESDQMAGWAQGDWDGSMFFDSGDFVAAFTDGGYELGPLPAGVAAVPEPSSLVLALLSVLGLVGVARRRNG